MIEFENSIELTSYLKSLNPTNIAIDGRDVSDRTFITAKIYTKLGGVRLIKETYREAALEDCFSIHHDILLKDIEKNLNNTPINYDSCFSYGSLTTLKPKNSIVIYVKYIYSFGN